ncbi:general substrate transporter [Epithele typhae]|uniref:general substrate transporter n=1 Tax=Epithele typhae TaxID=378194 RepID=UPI0020085AEA|nr:general substrate transporter [Epithele typhae]KAH9938966.1 general substrate transporter [Epithele typhae]
MLHGNEAFRSVPNKDSHLVRLLQLNLLLTTIFVAQFLNGYDSSLISGFQSMPSWPLKVPAGHKQSSSNIGLLNAAGYLTGMFTAPFAAYIADRWGRKWCIRYSSLANLIGTALGCIAGAGGVNGYAVFMVSRIIIGSGLTFAVMCSPIMLQELPHPKHRTILAGAFDIAFIGGNFVASWVLFGCGHLKNNWAWRVPYLIHIPFALIMIVLITFVPESPRWLIRKGREDEAKLFFIKYHSNGVEDEFVHFELDEVHDALRVELETKQDTWSVILSSRNSLHRLACAVLIAVCQNLSGTAIIAYCKSATVLGLVGITDTVTVTGINAGLTTFTCGAALLGLYLTQVINRRPQLFGTWIAVLLANIGLISATAMYEKTGSSRAGIAAVAMVWLYNGSFFISCGSIFFSYPAEVLHYSMRSKGMMVWTLTAKSLSVFSAYTNPVAMEAIGWKWYLFYTAILIVTGVLMYFVLVETRGYTLEEYVARCTWLNVDGPNLRACRISEAFGGKPFQASALSYKDRKDGVSTDVKAIDEESSIGK